MNGADKVRHTLRLNGGLWTRDIDRRNHSIIEAGCIREFTRMSYPEMGEMFGHSHTTMLDRVKKFNALPWRERYAWLSLVAETVGIGDCGVRKLTEAGQ
jgi:hypothetical protein